MNKKNNQINSKKRVNDHGEVFTNQREVEAMLNLFKQETERVDSRFLEPACGTGNFLLEILRRKLNIIKKNYYKNQIEYERYAVIATSSLYGIDILQDNVVLCRNRLFNFFNKEYTALYKNKCKMSCRNAVKFIFSKNILWGDALSLKTPNENPEPIIFSEWNAINQYLIKRRDYTLSNLLECQPLEGLNLFSDLGEKAFIPKPVSDYPLVHFLKLGDI